MTERSKTCVVVVKYSRCCPDWPLCEHTQCGKPVAGERDDWPMCAEHMVMFPRRQS